MDWTRLRQDCIDVALRSEPAHTVMPPLFVIFSLSFTPYALHYVSALMLAWRWAFYPAMRLALSSHSIIHQRTPCSCKKTPRQKLPLALKDPLLFHLHLRDLCIVILFDCVRMSCGVVVNLYCYHFWSTSFLGNRGKTRSGLYD